MPLKTVYKDVGPPSVPRETRELRKHSLEFHNRLGQPVIFKRRKTLQDIEDGAAVECPYHQDDQYDAPRANCPYCFGTGILGGFDDGIITFIVIGDAPTDMFRLTETGLMEHMTHPIVTAPWQPLMKDGDLIIAVDLNPDDYTPIPGSDEERFILDQVTPVRPRGSAPLGFATRKERGRLNFTLKNDMIVNQQMQVDKLPDGHIFWNVPYTDDAIVYPEPPDVPPGYDPDDPDPTPDPTNVASRSAVVRLIGTETGSSGDDVDVTFPPEYE